MKDALEILAFIFIVIFAGPALILCAILGLVPLHLLNKSWSAIPLKNVQRLLVAGLGVILTIVVWLVLESGFRLVVCPDHPELALCSTRPTEAVSPAATPTPATTAAIQPGETPKATETPANAPASGCGSPHPSLQGVEIPGSLTIESLNGSCAQVNLQTNLAVQWDGVPDGAYYLWILVYSPRASRYYPWQCGADPLASQGERTCQVDFAKSEPYDLVVILADLNAHSELQQNPSIKPTDLPGGIAEKDSHLVVSRESP